MPFLIAFYLYLRVVRRTLNLPPLQNTTYYPPVPKPDYNEWDKLINHPFNEYEW